jgi:lipid A ethanolaminephosphotransferase
MQISSARSQGALSAPLGHIPRFSDKGLPTIQCRSDVHFAFCVSVIWVLGYNGVFWTQTLHAMWHPALHSALFLISLLVFTVTLQSLLLLLLPQSWMRPAASALFVVAAVSAYFCSAYGAVMNQDMLRNVLQTDGAEVGALVSPKLLVYLIVLGFVPAAGIWRVTIAPAPFSARVKQRSLYAFCALVLSATGLFATSADYAVFFREHKPIRYMLMPAAPVTSFIGLLTHREHVSGPLLNPAGRSERIAGAATTASPETSKPKVMLLVIGETARAANFSLGGYSRPTNARLQQVHDLVYFDHATSCGTATAISLPCMFSPFPRTAFRVDEADRYQNLLDALLDAGIQVEWRDNDSGCKGVCARVQTINYADQADARHCAGGHCYDSVMLEDLPERLRAITADTVIVLHQIGSHGPAYSKRYPADLAIFRPACSSNELQTCSHAEIVNAYDNTIAATDAFLAKAIEVLQKHSDRLDGAMLYVSDHGESLGEQGLYLHGMPYAFAPRVQTEVPFMVWTSAGFRRDQGVDVECLRAQRNEPLSHDNLYHTVLGAMNTRNAVYDASLDVFAQCRSTHGSGELARSATISSAKKQS